MFWNFEHYENLGRGPPASVRCVQQTLHWNACRQINNSRFAVMLNVKMLRFTLSTIKNAFRGRNPVQIVRLTSTYVSNPRHYDLVVHPQRRAKFRVAHFQQ